MAEISTHEVDKVVLAITPPQTTSAVVEVDLLQRLTQTETVLRAEPLAHMDAAEAPVSEATVDTALTQAEAEAAVQALERTPITPVITVAETEEQESSAQAELVELLTTATSPMAAAMEQLQRMARAESS